jgi:cytochrome c553
MQPNPPNPGNRRFSLTLGLALAYGAFLPAMSGAAELSGEAIFRAKCAACHGAHGEGTRKHKAPLAGSRSAAQILDLIAKTMPEDDPGTLSTDEAKQVAAYVYDSMYSAAAQARNRPARIELARLTVRQYRQTVADLVGSFREPIQWGDKRGLKADYFRGRNFDSNAHVLDRVDPQVKFDFGTDAPVQGKIDPREFSIQWNGSVLAPDTGDYEFIIHTEHAVRLWVNERNRPLVDGWVKSNVEKEHRATIYLVGGRPYTLRMEFSKAKQGVDDKKKNKGKDKPSAPASIVLSWKRPFGVEEVIPARQLSPNSSAETFACATPFPPDDRSYGWERGTTVSKEWDEATTEAAIETAEYVAARINDLAGTQEGAKERAQKLRDFCRKFAERAFRRPLTADENKLFVDKQFTAAKDPDIALKRVVLLTLESPQFLYREIGGGGAKDAGYGVACRLSYGLWDSMPDQELFSAAGSGQLSTKEQVAKQAERMLRDVRARDKLRGFLLTWLKADQVRDIAKDSAKFPGFDPAVIDDLRTSLELFLSDVVWSDKSDFRQLFLADDLFLNGRLAKFYGANLPADAGFTKVKLDANQRAGVLTHPYLMASFAHNKDSSPILRGVFLARGILAVSLRPPPAAFAPLAPELQPTLSTRERVSLQTKAANCMTCHGIINPLGFTFEHFDAVGRYRDRDNGKPIDSSGTYRTRSGRDITVNNAHELAAFLVESDEARSAFVDQLFHHLVQQPVQAYGPKTPDSLRRSFADNGFSIRKLVVEIMAESALTGRSNPTAGLAVEHH